MPATMKPTKPATVEALKAAATASWRRWAHDLADGRGLPPTAELAEAAAVLGRPLEALERDAEMVREFATATAVRDQWRAAAERVEAEKGDQQELRAEIERLREQVEELERRERSGLYEALSLGQAQSRVRIMTERRPDLFGETT